MARNDVIVTLVAAPPDGAGRSTDAFLTAAVKTLEATPRARHRIIEVSSVRDIDLALTEVFLEHTGRIRLQIIGHTISGALALGAFWMPDTELPSRASKFPYYMLDTNPAALGLLSKHAGKISELMLVGCHIGSARSFGYAINGRTLTYTLSELLHCTVLGADDVIASDEFDPSGWYKPSSHRLSAKGWRWVESGPRVWTARAAVKRRAKPAIARFAPGEARVQ